MPTGFQPEDLASPWTLVGLAFCLVLFGVLMPRWLHKSIIDDKNKEIDAWRSTANKALDQNAELLEQSKTSLHIGEEIKRLGEGGET
ncbi:MULTISPECIES: hypothetical protein [Rhodococcus]|uniref:hypothetical protein n=1 Tax=Rhodococcus TaxID=1827 RepID=UPI0029539D86|nr:MULTISPECIES: hypothetical protein [Rhodococcus]MDV7244468.1 hypothetical protein [Rhodococcus oxybenzonivorans]MDV7274289.1 hypothetical protein [Rhodococcus oxybenzonivorans]MDV7337825.1 hypothetical protein [Rhodococcus oxybenzonivorans]MDV7345239.1 hypothetical protein [Rhodococcus oxybenzonivorans]MDV8028927.1 hypothetical protein [Rhodococcus sp. IEGM 27]